MIVSLVVSLAALVLAAVGVLPTVFATKRDPKGGFRKEELAIIRSSLIAERIALWLRNPNVLQVVTIEGGVYHGRLGIVANSLLKALKDLLECEKLHNLSTSNGFTRRFRAHLDKPLPAVRNLWSGGVTLSQVLVLPDGTVDEPASLATTLALRDDRHEIKRWRGTGSHRGRR
jgi:hypothetical protein